MPGQAAGASVFDGIDGVKTAGGAARFVIHVTAFAEELIVVWSGSYGLLMVRCPLQFDAIDVPAVKGARSAASGIDVVLEAWDYDCRENADDCNDDHDFQKCESAV